MEANREFARIERAASYLREKTGSFQPEILAVLGSGLGKYAESPEVRVEFSVPYGEIPEFPRSTVSGHEGKLLFCYVGDVPIMIMQGRIHMYEGYSAQDVVLPLRAARLLGAKALILTNAAGGINRHFKPGDLMMITDHISSFIQSPLKGENLHMLGKRFPDMSDVYSEKLREQIKFAAEKIGVKLKEGVYLQITGPQYETSAEIRMMSALGADAVGMSTVCEAIAAKHMGMEICGISCITNMAAGISNTPLSHEEVKRTADTVEKNFCKLMTEVIFATMNHLQKYI